MKHLRSGVEDDGGVKSEGRPASADCGQDHTSGDFTPVISGHTSIDHTLGWSVVIKLQLIS